MQRVAAPRRVQPFTSTGPVLGRRAGQAVARAASGDNGVLAEKPVIPQLSWYTDGETIRDVFAFAGPAPEVLQGRGALLCACARA